MTKFKTLLIIILILLLPDILSYGDVIITSDDMILSGKIIEDNTNDNIKFGNYHGVFTINYSQIKEIHRTKSFEEDVQIFKNRGMHVDENEVAVHYQAGIKKIELLKNTDKNMAKGKGNNLFFSPFFNINFGNIHSVLPYSFGYTIIGDIPFYGISFFKKIFASGLQIELKYLHSEKGVEKIAGGSASAGPFWRFPVSILNFHFDYSLSPVAGIGYYSTSNAGDKDTAVKWNAAFSTGPVFYIYSAIISPQIKIDYIFDKDDPLLGAGFSIQAGLRF